MTIWPAHRRRGLAAAGLGTVIAVLAACGSGGHPAASPAPPAARSAPEPTSPAAAAPVIKANWAVFFDLKLPMSRRLAVLQNGEAFASVVRAGTAESRSTAPTARVTRVSVVTPTRAEVTYTIEFGGKPVLANQPGTAVYQNGVWKVGDSSVCALLTLQNGGDSSLLPAVCKALSPAPTRKSGQLTR